MGCCIRRGEEAAQEGRQIAQSWLPLEDRTGENRYHLTAAWKTRLRDLPCLNGTQQNDILVCPAKLPGLQHPTPAAAFLFYTRVCAAQYLCAISGHGRQNHIVYKCGNQCTNFSYFY